MSDFFHIDGDARIKVAHAGVAWSGVGVAKFLETIGITSWGEAAAMAAFIYSCLLIIDWVWKKWRKRGHREQV